MPHRSDWNSSRGVRLLDVIPEVRELAEEYVRGIDIPDECRADAYHLALASWHGMDALLTWNCRHIANARAVRIVQEINVLAGIRVPVICTLPELMGAW
jgi:hypothetical protein